MKKYQLLATYNGHIVLVEKFRASSIADAVRSGLVMIEREGKEYNTFTVAELIS